MAVAFPTTDRRALVLDAALELFEERTFHGTAMPLVAERAGVGAGTIYRYFASKEELVNVLFRQWKLGLATALGPAGTAASGRDGFVAYWAGLTDFVLEHPREFAFLETHRHQPYLDDESRALAAAIDDDIEAFIRRHQRRGEIRRGNPAELIALVLGSFVGLVRASVDGRFELTRRRLLANGAHVWALIASDTALTTPLDMTGEPS